ncbi:MAG: GumC family protein [Balneolaceae bacterium]
MILQNRNAVKHGLRYVSQNSTNFFDLILTLLRHKITILIIVVPLTILSLIISLVWPQTFKSSSEVIQLQQSAPSVGGLLQNFTSINLARDRVGGETIVVILNSQTLRTKVIEEFNLSEVYKSEIQEELLFKLNQNIHLEPVREGGFGFNPIVSVKLAVTDREPERAQQMNQFILDELTREMEKYNRQSSDELLTILESRFEQNLKDLEEAEIKLNRFQNEYGILDVNAQVTALIEGLADLKADITLKEIELSVLDAVLDSNASQYRSKQLELRELKAAYQRLIERSENIETVEGSFYPLRDFPDLLLQFVRLQREVQQEQAINETLFPQLEQQRISYRNSSSGLKFVDEPNYPTYKDSPKRAIIVLSGMLFSIFLSFIIVFIKESMKDPESEAAIKLKKIRSELSFSKQ